MGGMTSVAESRLRAMLVDWVRERQAAGLAAFDYAELERVSLGSDAVRALDRQRGIWRPQGFRAALSIKTTFTQSGQDAPYEDSVGPDGLLRYKYEGSDPDYWTNVALRNAMIERVPLVWFIGIAKGRFVATAPVWLVGEESASHQFVVAVEPSQLGLYQPGRVVDELQRRYVERVSMHRLHQPVFRGRVLTAYQGKCAICRLQHPDLLDAAHIIADSDELGVPVVANGLSLCKIHHAAFDRNILGIDPKYTVHIRADILAEVDGPMLRHGLQDLHRHRLAVLPARTAEQPDPGRLEQRWEQFQRSA